MITFCFSPFPFPFSFRLVVSSRAGLFSVLSLVAFGFGCNAGSIPLFVFSALVAHSTVVVKRKPDRAGLVIVQDNPLVARAQDVAIDGADLGAPARVPTNAHPGVLVLLHGHVALVIAVLANTDAFETRRGAFPLDFATQVFLGLGAG